MTSTPLHAPPDLTDPDWLPTDQEELEVLNGAARRVAWEKAMLAKGIKVHTLGLSPEEQLVRIEAWSRAQASDDERTTER